MSVWKLFFTVIAACSTVLYKTSVVPIRKDFVRITKASRVMTDRHNAIRQQYNRQRSNTLCTDTMAQRCKDAFRLGHLAELINHVTYCWTDDKMSLFILLHPFFFICYRLVYF
jgi:hypothetical protein